ANCSNRCCEYWRACLKQALTCCAAVVSSQGSRGALAGPCGDPYKKLNYNGPLFAPSAPAARGPFIFIFYRHKANGKSMLEFFQTLHWGAILQIIMIDILLGGDNAVIIALACRNLAPKQRMQGILWGTAGAIGLRVVLIAFALVLLEVPLLKVVGGLLLLWIGIKLLLPDQDEHGNVTSGTSIWGAVKTILIADLVMSLDNVIASAGAAQNTHADHQMYYVIFGLIVSVPIIIWRSTLVLKLI